MSRSAKIRKSQPARGKSAGGTLIGMFIGLVLGVAIAAGVVFYLNKSPLPFVDKGVNTNASGSTKPGNAEPLPLPGKPGDPVPEKRFQFYDILPGKSEPVPDKVGDKPAAKPDAKATDTKPEEKKEVAKEDGKESKQPLFLQAGSFSTPQDADNQKAKLAFMGIEAVVQQVMVQDKTYFRVRVGPYHRIEDLNKIRADLAKAGIEAQMAKSN